MLDRIAIHSVPRSGSTWLGQIFNSCPQVVYKYQPLFSYAFKGRLDPTSTTEQIREFFGEIAEAKDEFLDQVEAVEAGIVPDFGVKETPRFVVYKEVRYHHILENLVRQDSGLKLVGLIRNPLSVLASWRKAPREFHPDWNFENEWRTAEKKNQGRPEEFYGFDKWIEFGTILMRLEKAYPDRVRLVGYSDLIRNTRNIIEDVFEFCGIPMGPETIKFIDESRRSHQDDVYSVFKSKTDDAVWEEVLPPRIVEAVREELTGTPLEPWCGSG